MSGIVRPIIDQNIVNKKQAESRPDQEFKQSFVSGNRRPLLPETRPVSGSICFPEFLRCVSNLNITWLPLSGDLHSSSVLVQINSAINTGPIFQVYRTETQEHLTRKYRCLQNHSPLEPEPQPKAVPSINLKITKKYQIKLFGIISTKLIVCLFFWFSDFFLF